MRLKILLVILSFLIPASGIYLAAAKFNSGPPKNESVTTIPNEKTATESTKLKKTNQKETKNEEKSGVTSPNQAPKSPSTTQNYTSPTTQNYTPTPPSTQPLFSAQDCADQEASARNLMQTQAGSLQDQHDSEVQALARDFGRRGIPLSSQLYLTEVAKIDAKYASLIQQLIVTYNSTIDWLNSQGCHFNHI